MRRLQARSEIALKACDDEVDDVSGVAGDGSGGWGQGGTVNLDGGVNVGGGVPRVSGVSGSGDVETQCVDAVVHVDPAAVELVFEGLTRGLYVSIE